jgi:uncharacterized protein YbjQ (UPF0145 family)
MIMRALPMAVLALVGCVCTSAVEARNALLQYSIADVLQSAEFKEKVGDDVVFYFGNQRTPPVAEKFGDYRSEKTTNAVGKSDDVSCRRAMLSALIQFHDRAVMLGGNAVINMTGFSNVKDNDDVYECRAGGFVTRVLLKGTVVKLGR